MEKKQKTMLTTLGSFMEKKGERDYGEEGESNSNAVEPLNRGIPYLVLRLISGYIPKKEHANAVSVSKDWEFALSPSEWSKTRQQICVKKEQSLYIRIKFKSCYHWYLLNENHNPQLTINPKLFTNAPAPAKIRFSETSMAVLGPKIFIIGGTIDGFPINMVWSFDCASSTIQNEPKLLVGKESSVVETVNGSLYVMGGRWIEQLDENSNRVGGWVEKFDPDIREWQEVSCPVDFSKNWVSTSCVVDGSIYARAFDKWIVFNPIKEEWNIIESIKPNIRCRGKPAVLDGVIYFQQFSGYITGYDVEKNKWKKLRVEQWKKIKVGNEWTEIKVIFPEFLYAVTMAALNVNLCVLWEEQQITHEHVNEKQEITQGGVKVGIMCVEIKVSKGADGRLNGMVLWEREILQLPFNSSAVHCLSVCV